MRRRGGELRVRSRVEGVEPADYSAREVAEVLGTGEVAVRQAHRRARRRMASYDAARGSEPSSDAVRRALESFLLAVGSGDAAAVESLLAEDVRELSDGGGEFHAARMPILGRDRVARFGLGLAKRAPAPPRIEVRRLNGAPALLVEIPGGGAGFAPRLTLHARLDGEGRIAELWAVLASSKLTRVT